MEPDMLFFDVDTSLPDITFDFTFDTPLPPPVPVFKGQEDQAASTTFVAAPPLDATLSPTKRATRRAPPSPLSNGTSEDDQGAPSSGSKGKNGKRQPQRRQQKKRAARVDDDDDEEDDADDTPDTSSSTTHMPNSDIKYVPSERRGNAFDFSKTEIASMTCEDLDAYTEQVQAHHTLSSEEQKYLKKYRRQIRNRECAQNMRARKRQYTETLEGTIDGLQHKVKQEEERASRAEKERDTLQERVRYLEGLLRQRSIPFEEGARPHSRIRGPIVAAGAGSLLAVMLSLAVFFGPIMAPGSQPPMPGASLSRAAELFEPTPASAPVGTGRGLLVAEADLQAQAALEDSARSPASPLQRLVRPVSEAPSGPKRIPIVEQGPARIRPATTAGTQLQERSEKSALMVSPSLRQHSVPSAFDAKFDRPDTEYMYCPSVHSMYSTHRSEDTADGSEEFPSRVSLIIPGDAFNSSNLFQHMNPPPPLVEVSCSVVDIWPVWPEGAPGVAP